MSTYTAGYPTELQADRVRELRAEARRAGTGTPTALGNHLRALRARVSHSR